MQTEVNENYVHQVLWAWLLKFLGFGPFSFAFKFGQIYVSENGRGKKLNQPKKFMQAEVDDMHTHQVEWAWPLQLGFGCFSLPKSSRISSVSP